jgi:hypothetical protein
VNASTQINDVIGGLTRLSERPAQLIGEDRTFMEIWGWNMPAMNRHEFAEMIKSPVVRLQKMQQSDVSESDLAALNAVPNQISYIETNVINNLPGGNAFHVYITIYSLIQKIDGICDRYVPAPVDLKEIEDKNLLPPTMIKQLQTLQSDIADVANKRKGIEDRINVINEAGQILKTLPNQIADLKGARESYTSTQALIS